MSLFNAFGHGGFAALTQTLENIGNIVAPIAPNDDEADPNRDEDDDEESESFDSKVQSFFSNMRDQYQQGGSLVAESDTEPSTPTSMVSVELGAGSPRQSGKSKETSPRSIDSGSFGYVSGPELEKKVQLKYREQLEDEISSFDRKYTELQSSSAKKIQLLEQECAEWKLLAEEFKGQGSIGSDDNAEELNTLYEKLGSMTQELEDKEAELAAAQETIMALNADSISSNMRELDKDDTLQAQLTEVTDELIELRDKHAASDEHIQELTEALDRAEQSVLQRAEESNAKEDDLLNLTHQLRDSNKAISALEQKLADAEAALTTAPVPFSPDAAASLMVDDLQQRLREMQQRQTEVADHLHLAEEQNAQIRAAFMSLQTENSRLTEENISLQAQLSSSTHAAAQIAENIQAVQRDLEDAKGQLQTAHEEVRVLGEQLAARDRAFEESERVHALQLEQVSAAQVIEPSPSMSEETEKLAAQAQELRAELDRVLAQLQGNDAAHSALSTQHSAVKEEFAEALNELSIVNDSMEELRLQLAAAVESQTRAEKREQDLMIELEQLRLELANVSQSVVAETDTQALEEALGRLQEAQVALLNRQQQLDAKEEDLAQSRLEISSLRVQLAAAAEEREEIQNSRSERIEELNDKVSRLSAELSDVVNERNEAERAQEALQEQLSILESRLGDAVEESSSLQVAMKGVRSQLAVMTDERDSALTTVQQLESQLAQQVTAPPAPSSAATSESPKVLISKSSSADLDVVIASAAGTSKAAATATTTEEALTASQAEFAKAVKKIKAVNKQLKDRDAEIVKLKEGSAAMMAELATLHAQHNGDAAMESPVAGAGNDVDGSVSDLETLLATAQSRIQELESERIELLARLDEMSNTTSSMSALHSELTAAQARVTQLDEALTTSEEALKSTEEVAWQAKAEASELLFAYEQEQSRVQQLTAARDALQEEATSTRRVLAQLVDQSEPAQNEEGQLPLPALVESTFKDLRARCDKEAQELHALHAQRSGEGDELQQLQFSLNESFEHVLSLEDGLAVKEAEIDSLKAVVHELSSQSEGAEQEVRQQLAQKQKELDLLLAETVKERQMAEALREETQLRISMFESLVTEKTEELEFAQRQVTEMEAEMQRVLAEHRQVQAELTAAQARLTELDEALTSSEEALKSTEEVAWQAKAEASELLFAYEQEQSRVQQLTTDREALQDQLGSLQAQLKSSAEESTSNRIAHLDEVQAQLFAMYHSLRAASDLLRFLDEGSAGSNATPSKELTTFEHLVTHCGTDLLGPLSMLALISKTQASLADQIMTHLREQSEQLRALQETEKNATAALHEGSKLLTTLLRVVKSGSTNEDAPAQTTDLALLARRISHDLNAALNETEQRLFSETSGTQQAIALQEQLEQALAELALEKESAVREKLALTTQIEQSETRIAALQNEVSDHAAQFEDAFRKLSLEKQQVASELQQVQAGSAQYSEQMQTFKSHIQKIETENKQLHQVIAQLRQVRKTTKGESDNAITERDELRAHCVNLQADVHALQQQLRMLTETEESAALLRSELTQVTASLVTSERNLESTRRSLAQVEKECYDKSAELEVTRTDILLIRQELDRRHVEVSNLKEAIQQVESERDFYVSRAQRELAEKLKAAQAQSETERKDLEARLSQQLEGERAQRIKLEEARQDHELFHRKAELEFNQEKKKMQRTLENALAQLNNSQQQVIDRMLVANLIVSYFKRRRSVDVLKIIAKVLSFDDEQLIAVGLKVPPIDLLGSLLSTVIGRPAPAPEVKGDNLAEQWINFLIDESDQDAANSAGLVPRARSHSDAVSSPTANAKMGADVDLTYK